MRKYIFLDTETTGKDEIDRIVQLSYFVYDISSELPTIYDDYCNPEIKIPYIAMETHHITNEFIENKPHIKDTKAYRVLEELNDENNIMIIHNAPFDIGMLKKEDFEWRGKIIDTLKCSKHLLPDMESFRLTYLRYALEIYKEEEIEAKKLGIEIKYAHDAVTDILLLKLLFNKLMGLIDRKVSRLIELSSKNVILSKINFGKYSGKSFQEIKLLDNKYLEWLSKNSTDEDVLYTISTLK